MQLEVIRLELDGVLMPAPMQNGVEFSTEHIWSKNAGRNARSTMVGTIAADKGTVTIKWPPLTERQVTLIESHLSRPGKPWVSIRLEMADSTVIAFLGYSGPHKSVGWKPVGGIWRRFNMQVTIIER